MTPNPTPPQPAVPEPGDSQPPARKTKIVFWECPNCGQSYFGEQPPDMCAYCQDFTTWRRVPPDVLGGE